ncbi:MAG: hypothetical protein QG620_931 [Patescibacteria group bacterium]|nr:hypothetical protein [Patescibacteria group bacterium]
MQSERIRLKTLLFAVLFFGIFGLANFSHAASPVLFYSDITSGPNSGGQNDKGVFATVWGKGFGDNQDDSHITVGGGLVDNYPEWSDTKICFQLGSEAATGDIVVVVGGISSNGLPFTVRTGNIYFISSDGSGDGSHDAPMSPTNFCNVIKTNKGSIGYFRAGTYTGEYAHAGWHAMFTLEAGHSGLMGQENAFIAYPGEIVTLSHVGEGERSIFRIMDTNEHDIVVAKFRMISTNGAVATHSRWRVVGNDIDAIHAISASGAITTGQYQDNTSEAIYIYGNNIHGGSSGANVDHAIYPGSGSSNVFIGWNYIHDNNFGTGATISLNCNNAYNLELVSENVRIFNNIIDMSAYGGRATGVFETGDGSSVYHYNNVIIGPPSNQNDTMYAHSANVYYYNNTLYNVGSLYHAGVFSFYADTISGSGYTHDYAPESITLRNNIVYAASNASSYLNCLNISGTNNVPTPINDHNLWHGIGSFAGHSGCDNGCGENGNSLESDPLFSNAPSDLSISASSSAINVGADMSTIFTTDINGLIRTDAFDIGAYEYVESGGDTTAPQSPAGLSVR